MKRTLAELLRGGGAARRADRALGRFNANAAQAARRERQTEVSRAAIQVTERAERATLGAGQHRCDELQVYRPVHLREGVGRSAQLNATRKWKALLVLGVRGALGDRHLKRRGQRSQELGHRLELSRFGN